MTLFSDRSSDGDTKFSAFADGAPSTPQPRHMPWDNTQPAAPVEGSTVERVVKSASRIRQFEGWRGYSNRALVALRQLGAFLIIALGYLTAEWAFAGNPTWEFGGEMMVYSAAFIQFCAALGSIIYAESRYQIIEQARHFTFGIVVLPATALSIFMKIITSAVDTSTSSDIFTGMLLGNGLPLLYFSVVVIPAFVFAKYIFGGLRSVNRKAMADEETLSTYMRQDYYR